MAHTPPPPAGAHVRVEAGASPPDAAPAAPLPLADAPVPAGGSRPLTSTAIAALLYLGVALWSMRDLQGQASTHVLGPPEQGPMSNLYRTDQEMVLGTVIRNARLFTEAPGRLGGPGQCFPFPKAYTLGEHMFGNGALAALPWILTREPVLSYNIMLILTLWIPALAMYALALHFTRDPPAAFLAGLIFELARPRLLDPAHPYVHGDLWAPLILLFLHRTFARPTWTSAAALGGLFLLQMGESIYALLATTLLATAYGACLVVAHRRRLMSALPRLALAATAVLIAARTLFLPYLETGRTWGVLQGRASFLGAIQEFAPGEKAFPGAIASGLTAIGLLDRALRRRPCAHGEDPRIPIALAGFFVLWCSITLLPVPGLWLPSPLLLAGGLIPGLDAVRALSAVRIGVYAPVALLAGLGLHVILTRWLRPPALGVIVAIPLAAIVLAEAFHPATAVWNFGTPLHLVPWRIAPPAAERRAVALVGANPGPVLELPTLERRIFLRNAHAVLLSAWHGQPTSACYNSFQTALTDQVSELSLRVPLRPALDALAALGFGTLAIHQESLFPRHANWLGPRLVQSTGPAGPLALMSAHGKHLFYDITAAPEISEDFALLAPPTAATSARLHGPRAALRFHIRNTGRKTFRHPTPVEPSEVVLRWLPEEHAATHETRARALLPIAIGADGTLPIVVETEIPVSRGRWRVQLARAVEPGRVLGETSVKVFP